MSCYTYRVKSQNHRKTSQLHPPIVAVLNLVLSLLTLYLRILPQVNQSNQPNQHQTILMLSQDLHQHQVNQGATKHLTNQTYPPHLRLPKLLSSLKNQQCRSDPILNLRGSTGTGVKTSVMRKFSNQNSLHHMFCDRINPFWLLRVDLNCE